jgi:protein O-GlcNAc transferase
MSVNPMNRQSSGAAAEGDPPPTGNPARGAAKAAVPLSVSDLFAAALAHHQAGRLAEAEAHYRQVLAAMPEHSGALHLLGVIAYQRGSPEMAVQLIERAIKRDGSDPSYFVSCGLALEELKHFEEALECYNRALSLKPDYPEALNNRGNALQMLGRFAQAVESYNQALALRPDLVEAYFNRGEALRDLGRLDDARASYDRALAVKPDFPEILSYRGDVLRDSGQLEDAVANYDRALVLKPNYPEAWLNRGVALEQLDRFEEALESYDRALAARPHFVEAHYNRGNALRQLKLPENALQNYDRALAVTPNFAEALNNRGLALAELGRFDEALESYDRALAVRPYYAEALNNRGSTLDELRRYDEALESYRRALAVKSDFAEALNNRGLVLRQLGRFDEALQSFDGALAAKPEYPGALSNRGVALRELGRFDEALESYDQALAVKPDFAGALNNRGNILVDLGRLDEALQSYERLLAIGSDVNGVSTAWFHTKRQLCDWSGYHEGEERARNAVRTHASLGMEFKLLALSSTPEEQLDCARRVAAKIAVPKSAMLPHPQPRPGERVRLGYLSADFRQHPTAFVIAGLIERHDRRDFEVVGYSYGPTTEDKMRARLSAGFDHFVDICKMPHRQAAELIRADAVDILIDLTGFTRYCRPAILAYRPAPIQVNYLGYGGTMGADFIDYIIVDPFVVPPDQQPFFNERLVHLPNWYLCNDDTHEIAERTPARTECDLPEQDFVFCCYLSYKLTPGFFDVWMRLLNAVPGSVLWLVAANSNSLVRDNLRREAVVRGVASERLVFATPAARPEYLARLALADLFLDTLPYNAGATASDALGAGLPVLTCSGSTFVGRMAGSLLTAAGLPELITDSLDAYERLALRLATEPGLLAALRRKLARNRSTAPLFDIGRFTRDLEAAYWRMWERWRAGCPPAAFSVP